MTHLAFVQPPHNVDVEGFPLVAAVYVVSEVARPTVTHLHTLSFDFERSQGTCRVVSDVIVCKGFFVLWGVVAGQGLMVSAAIALTPALFFLRCTVCCPLPTRLYTLLAQPTLAPGVPLMLM